MDRKTLIVLLAAVVIIICLVFGFNKKDIELQSEENNLETNTELNYKKVTDEITEETYYQIYDEKTGEVIRNVVDESSIQMYIDNPDFVGPENEGNSEELEYNEY